MRSAYYRKAINSSRWRRLRAEVLHEHPLCQRCAEEGYVTAAREVHHIQPVDWARTQGERERRMFSPLNLMALCHRCHVGIHTRLGRSGRTQTRAAAGAETAEAIARLYGEGDGDPTPGGIF